MASKLIVLTYLVVAASAGIIQDHASSYGNEEDLNGYDFGHGDHNAVDYHSHPRYEFSYGVKDDHTGDDKTQQETRDGDAVKGSYTVVDPDGHKRIVEYSDDGHSGFKATVRREPIAGFVAHSGNSGFESHSGYSGSEDFGGHHQISDAYQGFEGHQGYEGHQAFDGQQNYDEQQAFDGHQSYDGHQSFASYH